MGGGGGGGGQPAPEQKRGRGPEGSERARMAAKGAKKAPATKKLSAKKAEGAKGKKKKKAKDPNKPKRAMVAFMFFSIDRRPAMQKANPQMRIAEISKLLGSTWREMTAKDKAPYEKKAAADKARYEKEMQSYKPPYKPKRAMVAFMFFSIEQRPAVQAKNKNLGIADISKILGANWRGLSDKAKAPYQQKAEKDKARYEKEMKLFKTQA